MSSIGNFQFLLCKGDLLDATEMVAENERAGIDYATFNLLGLRAETSTKTSYQTFATREEADQALKDYQALQGEGAQPIVEDNGREAKVKVLRVDRQGEVQYCPGGVGGATVPTNEYLLVCRWRLKKVGDDQVTL